MSTSYNMKIIQGFRVPYNRLFKDTINVTYNCEHSFDREEMKYCPECGKKSGEYTVIDSTPLIDLDFDELRDYDGALDELYSIVDEELILCPAYCNWDLEGSDKDYFLGIYLFNEDPQKCDETISEISLSTKEKILKKINTLPITIPYDEDSFGIYMLNEFN